MTTFTGHLTDAQAQRLMDGMLLEAEADEVLAHAGGCPECQALTESYRVLGDALGEALGALELPELPRDFTAGVLSRIDAREHAVRRERRFAVAILAAVLVAIGVTVVAAGAGTWAPAASRLAGGLGSAGEALRLGAGLAATLLSALRFQLALACAVLAVPLLFALSRLIPSARAELA
ncbi:conserved hypothetical protein [Anaeromyxobacter dehalogenans 2CP-1]|uniref:Uncharacterized protein n=1 Tax=Anaeromyxobacter dehalogenans (strain ATCC BAA-258 / DSM 21875 / 2CP-1) TaxID=455488 RepID=B8JA85_ANAD2|nr:zf-HC2 domain-containing protein [Anaeromyxobacter dehalogenans]ACL65604.1 conserved hypothetical protein [Anaeromyxobacter dehalogenans 2CP-1]